jgi:hypothetical protein
MFCGYWLAPDTFNLCLPMQIRFWLVCAYWLLALHGALGFPPETQWFSSTGIFVAGVVGFSVVGGALHTAAFLRLVWDERSLRIRGGDEEQLWRLMYRRSGMNRLEFHECIKLGSCGPTPNVKLTFPLSLGHL